MSHDHTPVTQQVVKVPFTPSGVTSADKAMPTEAESKPVHSTGQGHHGHEGHSHPH